MSLDAVENIIRLGVVSFLNSRPLVEGLDREPGVKLHFAVPARLSEMLRGGEVDAALIPVIDLARSGGAWRRISDACIGSDGPTMTVRVFSHVPAERIRTLHVDPDSHTSVALARIIWSRRYDRRLELQALPPPDRFAECEAVLLIGDKVVTAPVWDFTYQIDLGGAWREWTGLPFVFAVWAAPVGVGPASCRSDQDPPEPPLAKGGSLVAAAPRGGRGEPSQGQQLADLLNATRDRGVARAAAIAAEHGPALGWPVALALEYLTRRLTFTLAPRHLQGLRRFLELAAEAGLIPDAGREVT